MSFALSILLNELEQGNIEVVTYEETRNVDLQRFFPKSLISDFELAENRPTSPQIQTSSELVPSNNEVSIVNDHPVYDDIDDGEMLVTVDDDEDDEYGEIRLAPRRKKKFGRILSTRKYGRFGTKGKRQRRVHQEIFNQKMTGRFAIPKEDFKRVVDHIMKENFPKNKIDVDAYTALQRESEMMISKMMCLASHLTDHASRETLLAKDFKLLTFLFKKNKEGCSFEM